MTGPAESGEPVIPDVIRRMGKEEAYLEGLRGSRLLPEDLPARATAIARLPQLERPRRTGEDDDDMWEEGRT